MIRAIVHDALGSAQSEHTYLHQHERSKSFPAYVAMSFTDGIVKKAIAFEISSLSATLPLSISYDPIREDVCSKNLSSSLFPFLEEKHDSGASLQLQFVGK